jgi:hypothetical protein
MAQTVSVFFHLFYLPGGGDFDCLKMRGAGRHRETHRLLSHAEILDVSGEETTLNARRFTSKKSLSTCKITSTLCGDDWPLYFSGKDPCYLLNGILCGPQSRSWRFREEKNIFPTHREMNHDFSIVHHSLITLQTVIGCDSLFYEESPPGCLDAVFKTVCRCFQHGQYSTRC